MRKILAVLAVAGLAGAAQAQVVNGDFETGDLTGWNSGGNLGFTAVTENYPFAGTYGFQMGPVGSTGFIAQTLPLNAGDQVTFSFMLASDGGSPTHFDAIIDGQTVLSLDDAETFDYTEYSFDVTITANNPTVQFDFQNNPAYFWLDNVSVTRVPAPTAALGLLGLPVAGLARRRRN